jgi:hypothetical protein
MVFSRGLPETGSQDGIGIETEYPAETGTASHGRRMAHRPPPIPTAHIPDVVIDPFGGVKPGFEVHTVQPGGRPDLPVAPQAHPLSKPERRRPHAEQQRQYQCQQDQHPGRRAPPALLRGLRSEDRHTPSMPPSGPRRPLDPAGGPARRAARFGVVLVREWRYGCGRSSLAGRPCPRAGVRCGSG